MKVLDTLVKILNMQITKPLLDMRALVGQELSERKIHGPKCMVVSYRMVSKNNKKSQLATGLAINTFYLNYTI